MKNQKVAFFDIDGTVMNNHLPVLLIKHFFANYEYRGNYAKKLEKQKNELEFARKRYKNYYTQAFNLSKKEWRVENYSEAFAEYSQKFYPLMSTLFEGYSEDEISKIAREVLHEYRYEAYAYSLELIKKLHSKDFRLIAISGSPQFLVDAFVEEFGFEFGIGCEFGIRDGSWQETGEMVTWCEKDKIARKILGEDFFANQNTVVAVGDTLGDLELLNMAQAKIIINAQFDLYQEISKNDEFVSVFSRKDLIFVESNWLTVERDHNGDRKAKSDNIRFRKGESLEKHFKNAFWRKFLD